MKIIVTGSKGQLGQEIVSKGKERGCKIYPFDHSSLDITDIKNIRETVKEIKPKVIINCAAYNYVDNAEKDWKQSFLTNAIGPKNLAIAAEESKSTLIHYSTDYVFDGTKNAPYTIFDSPNPLNKYAESKFSGEKFVKTLTNKYFIIRVSWVFGGGKSCFVTKLLNWARNRKELKMVTDQISIPTYCVDIAESTYRLLETESFGLYHMTNSGFTSRYDYAKYILDKIKWQGGLHTALSKDFDSPANRPVKSVLDNFPLDETIGYTMPSWQDAVQRFLTKINI